MQEDMQGETLKDTLCGTEKSPESIYPTVREKFIPIKLHMQSQREERKVQKGRIQDKDIGIIIG